MSGPIFFAWVDKDETTFNATVHAREDEDVFSFNISHEEGQIPLLTAVLQYPSVAGVAVGLLRTGRKQWVWLSWRKENGDIEPLFFGRLVGFPSQVNDILVPVQFLARATDYVAQKQALADTLKVAPYYDPVFLSDEALENPDSILEGWSAAYHVDRTTLQWSISDLLIGDETVVFDQSSVLDGSVEIYAREVPLRSVRVDATVHWKQNFRGTVIPVLPYSKVRSLTAKSLVSSWPQPGTSLGGGWEAAPGTFAEAYNTGERGNHEESGSFQDTNTKHNEGDAISANWSASIPLDDGFIINRKQSATYGSIGGGTNFLTTPPDSTGGIQVSTGDQQSSGSSSVSISYQVIYDSYATCTLYIKPNSDPNNFTETLSLTLSADVQSHLTDPTTKEETEVISLQGQDVGEAVIEYKCLTTLSGQSVQIGQILLPNLTPGPGGTSYQIALNAGTCGVVTSEEDAPLFSDVLGAVVTWGGVQFACVGAALPSIIDWTPTTFLRVGTVMCYESQGGWFYLVNQEGFTGSTPPTLNPSTGASSPDGGVIWTGLGSGGPSFVTPLNGQPGNITAASFFDKARGAACVENMLMVARNRLRTRSRAIEVGCRVPFEEAVSLSCRKMASIHDPNTIPGGWATGKIVSYTLSWDGGSGETYGEVKIACAVGTGINYATASLGTPTVADLDTFEVSMQVMEGASNIVGSSDLSYTPPPPNITYNGFTFPLTADQVVITRGWQGNFSQQLAIAKAALVQKTPTVFGAGSAISTAQSRVASSQKAGADMSSEAASIYYELWLRPIADQHCDTPYVVQTSPLMIPKQIDLGA